MTTFISLLTDWRAWLVAIFAGLVLANCTSRSLLEREKLAHEASLAQFSETVRLANQAHAAAEARNKNLEMDLIYVNKTKAQAVQVVLDAAQDAARSDAADRERLRQQVAEFADAGRKACSAPAAVAPSSTTGGDAIGVLAHVFASADERAGRLAAIADAARIRGLACEAEYGRARDAVAASGVLLE